MDLRRQPYLRTLCESCGALECEGEWRGQGKLRSGTHKIVIRVRWLNSAKRKIITVCVTCKHDARPSGAVRSGVAVVLDQ